MRTALGVVCLVAAVGTVLVAYANTTPASTCASIRHIVNSNGLGPPAPCHSAPSPGVWVVAAILAGIGILLLVWPRHSDR